MHTTLMIPTNCDGTVVVSPTNQTLKYNQCMDDEQKSKQRSRLFCGILSPPKVVLSVSVRPRKLDRGGAVEQEAII